MSQEVIKDDHEVLSLKMLIESFIQGRMQEKLNKETESEKIRESYNTENWLAGAARRVSHIQLVTHAIKYQNSAAKGSSVYLQVKQYPKIPYVSTRTLTNFKNDVVGSAGALDVFKFLQLSHNNETLLERMFRNDIALIEALPGTEEQKRRWLASFINIIQLKTVPSTHKAAKQIYFPVGKNQYHIIAPLFPTSLVQAVFEQIQTRFSDETRNARKAKKEAKFHPHGYREYIKLAVQNFGGSRPQNISQLNTVRGGKCYLLPSFPPNWRSQAIKPPLLIKTVFQKFNYRVRDLTKKLREFLSKTDYNNQSIRQGRADLVAQICDRLLFFAEEIQRLPAGWSKNVECQLPEAQAFWLDPGRAQVDVEWGLERQRTDWQSEISHDFSLWLNEALQTEKLRFGDDEYEEWKRLLKRELSMLTEVIS